MKIRADERQEKIVESGDWTDVDALRAAIDSLVEGIIVVDKNGEFLIFNRVAERIFGLKANEIKPFEWSDSLGCYYPDGTKLVPSWDKPLSRSLRGEEVDDFEMLIRNNDLPKGVLIRVSSMPLRDRRGLLRGAFVRIRDITDLKKTEEHLDRLSNAVEETADSVFITDKSGVIEYVNPAFTKTTGYSRAETLGRTPEILNSGQHPREFYDELWATISGGDVFRGTIINRKKDGQLYWTEQTITPMKSDGGEIIHYVSVLKDVTEQRRKQEQDFQIRLAREIQQRYYRETSYSLEGFDIAGDAVPAAETGGDYFDFLQMPDGCLGLAVGDVSGHGLGSALVMAETRAYIRSFTESDLDVGRILTRVNHALAADLEEGIHVTMLLVRLDTRKRTIVYASAGHIPGYILKKSGELGSVLNSTGLPLGLFAKSSYQTSGVIQLEKGDLMAFLTDGVTESTSPDEEEFGAGRVLEILRENRDHSSREIIEKIFASARGFVGEQLPHDDITSMICKVLP